jgi:phosphatidylserine synthase
VAVSFGAAKAKRLVDFTRRGYRAARFTGLATPAAAFTAVAMVHLLPLESDIPWIRSPTLQLLILGAVALLMISPLRYPKVRGWSGAALAAGLCGALLYLAIRKTVLPLPEDELYPQYNVLRFVAMAIILAYVIGGALYAAAVKK